MYTDNEGKSPIVYEYINDNTLSKLTTLPIKTEVLDMAMTLDENDKISLFLELAGKLIICQLNDEQWNSTTLLKKNSVGGFDILTDNSGSYHATAIIGYSSDLLHFSSSDGIKWSNELIDKVKINCYGFEPVALNKNQDDVFVLYISNCTNKTTKLTLAKLIK